VTLLGELALAFLIESVALAALWISIGAGAAYLAAFALGSRPPDLASLRSPALAGLLGAMVVGSLSLRLGAPEPMMQAVGRREVPILWSLGGALTGALLTLLAQKRARTA